MPAVGFGREDEPGGWGVSVGRSPRPATVKWLREEKRSRRMRRERRRKTRERQDDKGEKKETSTSRYSLPTLELRELLTFEEHLERLPEKWRGGVRAVHGVCVTVGEAGADLREASCQCASTSWEPEYVQAGQCR